MYTKSLCSKLQLNKEFVNSERIEKCIGFTASFFLPSVNNIFASKLSPDTNYLLVYYQFIEGGIIFKIFRCILN